MARSTNRKNRVFRSPATTVSCEIPIPRTPVPFCRNRVLRVQDLNLARVRTSGGFRQAIKMLPSELDCPPITKQGSRDSWFRDVVNLRHPAVRSRHHTKD